MENILPNDVGPIGIVGLGNMGRPIAENLLQEGYQVIGTAKSVKSRQNLINAGGIAVDNSGEVGQRCRYIILSLPSESAFRTVTADLASHCKDGTIVLETSTFPVAVKEEARKHLEESGVILLDAAVSGSAAQIKNKSLVVLGSGDSVSFEKFKPIINCFSKVQYYLGDFGNGMKMKFIANQLIAINTAATAEALIFGERMGLDLAKVVEVIGASTGSSFVFKARGPIMANRTWTPTTAPIRLFQKDLKLIADALQIYGSPSPLFSATLPTYNAAMASDCVDYDASAIFEILERMTKVPEAKN